MKKRVKCFRNSSFYALQEDINNFLSGGIIFVNMTWDLSKAKDTNFYAMLVYSVKKDTKKAEKISLHKPKFAMNRIIKLVKKVNKEDKKVKKVMHEFKEDKLHSGSKKGPVVKNKKQALAIAMSEAKKTKGKK